MTTNLLLEAEVVGDAVDHLEDLDLEVVEILEEALEIIEKALTTVEMVNPTYLKSITDMPITDIVEIKSQVSKHNHATPTTVD